MLLRPGSVGRPGQPARSSLTYALDATGEQIRAAIRDITRYASGGFLLPGTAGVRLNASARASVAMERLADGTYGYAPHNLLTYSEDLSNAAWAKTGVTVTADAATSPAGTVTADRIAGGSYLQQDATVVAGGRYTGSAYLKADAATTCTVTFGTGGLWGGDNPRCTFDLSAGTAGTLAGGATAATIETVGNGWYRCAVTAVCAVSGTTALRISTGVFAWGGQWNLGPVATAYIPTTSAAVYAPATSYDSTNGWGVHGEAARTNLALWNADMSHAAWVAAGAGAAKVGAAQALGVVPMYRINVGTTGGAAIGPASVIYQSITLAAATTYTVIALVRAVSGTSAFRLSGSTATGTQVGSSDQTATTTAQVFTFEFTTPSGTSFTGFPGIRAATAGGTVPDIEVGGFSVIAGSVPALESLILTFGSAVTRAADDPIVPHGTAIDPLKGTYIVDFVPAAASGSARGLLAHDNGASYGAGHGLLARITTGDAMDAGGNSSATPWTGATVNAGALNRFALAYQPGANPAIALSLNGGAVVSEAAGDYTGVGAVRTRIGNGPNGSAKSRIHRIRYTKTVATAAQLPARSTL